MTTLDNALLLLARLGLAFLFVVEGWEKIGSYAGVVDYMQQYGVPGFLLPGAIAIELGGGLLVVLGLFTRWASIVLAAFCVLTAVLFHGNISDGDAFIQFGKDVSIAGGFLALAVAGAGAWSVDALMRRR
ncbi:MAG: DoxX family protein [Hyphomicrobiales bacterium]